MDDFSNKVMKHFADYYKYIISCIKQAGMDVNKPIKLKVGAEKVKDGFELIVIPSTPHTNNPDEQEEMVLASGLVFESEEGVRAAAKAFNYWLDDNALAVGQSNSLEAPVEDDGADAALKKAKAEGKIIHFPKNKTVH